MNQKFLDACKAMWTTMQCPEVWKPCLYMYLSTALGLGIHEGMFYWYTDSKEGPSLSQVFASKIDISHTPDKGNPETLGTIC